MLQRLLKWIDGIFQRKRSFTYNKVKETPNHPKSSTLYLVANDDYYWQAVMVCPCGCKKVLFLNLMDDMKPNWSYSIDSKNKISMHPSIHRKTKCKSHFFIRSGNVVWV